MMVRNVLTAVLVSCMFGVLFGLSVAYSFLSVDGWQIELETNSYETLAETALSRATDPNAKAQISETSHHFGIMEARSTGSHDFFIRNVGTADLILKVDRTTCSCLGIDVIPNRVPPGGTAKCHLIYNAEQATLGRFIQGGVVLTNDPENREIQLRIEGIFTNPVVVRPSSITIPRVVVGTTQSSTIRFYSFEEEPLQLSSPIWEDQNHFDFQFNHAELSEADKADSYYSSAKSVVEGTLTLKPGLPIGTFQEWFQLRTNYLSQPTVIFVVSGQVIGGNVTISGQGYNRQAGVAELGNTVMGKSISREISIQFSGVSAPSASVHVSSVEPAWIRTQLSPPRDVGPLRIFSLAIEIPEDAPTGSYVFRGDGQRANVLLETNDEAMPVIRIPLQFTVGR
jgi:hypothetical protein